MSPFRNVEEVISTPKSTISIAGRVMLHRSFGKICFATLSDGTGRIQVLFSRENCSIIVDGEGEKELTGEIEPLSAYKFAEKLIDLGDFIGVTGELFYTHK
jgi:lysyl-tRNA synthetase, class II